jgi:hypothetical protein
VAAPDYEGVQVDDVVRYVQYGAKPRTGRVLEVDVRSGMRYSRRTLSSSWRIREAARVRWFRTPGHHGWKDSWIDCENLTVISRRPPIPGLRSDEV